MCLYRFQVFGIRPYRGYLRAFLYRQQHTRHPAHNTDSNMLTPGRQAVRQFLVNDCLIPVITPLISIIEMVVSILRPVWVTDFKAMLVNTPHATGIVAAKN